MKKQNIDTLFKQTSKLLSELSIVSSENGIHIDNDLDAMLFSLLIDGDYNEMFLFNFRVKTAITKIKNGTFKIENTDEILHNVA